MNFTIQELDLKGAFMITGFHVGDLRGGFTKSFEKHIFQEAGLTFQLSETFVSSSAKNVIRGLHFQTHTPQAKLVSVVAGRAWDVIVDLRFDSPTFRQWRAQELSADNHLSFYVPRGFAHGFTSLADGTIMLYQCDGAYNKETDTGIRFDDPDIGIAWPIPKESSIHSQRDLELQSLREFVTETPYGWWL